MGARIRKEYDLERDYYDWICEHIPSWRHSHGRLIWQMFETPFEFDMADDSNRAADGYSLRNRYCWEGGLNADKRSVLQAQRPCSVLEVAIAMALRGDEEYTTDYTEENPVDKWFGAMIRSLGVDRYDDINYDPIAVDIALRAMMKHDYLPDGRGGLFHVPGICDDMREIDLWEQMMAWIEYSE